MARSDTLSFLIVSLAVTGLLAVACDSGTQEPDAPTPEPLAIENTSAASADAMEAGTPEFPPSRYPYGDDLPEGVTAAIPDTFPEEFPIYPGSAPAQGRGTEIEGRPMAALQLLTMDSAETVYDFYREQLVSAGWTAEDNEAMQNKTGITATKGDCTATMFVTPTEDGGSDIFMISECDSAD